MLAKSTALDPANPNGLGISCCTACGQTVDVVGQLRPDGHCGVCGDELDRYDVLTDELRRVIEPWIVACRARHISDQIVTEVWELVRCDLEQFEGSVIA